MNQREKQLLIDFVKQGYSTEEIAEEFGYSVARICKVRPELDVEAPVGRPRKYDVKKMRELRSMGKSYSEISTETGASYRTVRRYV